ncbi:DUF6198 family protein [uncultured Holdemanella sp.]|uniref:YczE/YyaS/YitT family protein n=1 Tax=uncultured Holdemanella sp. TaxID=1763549 RepID=UPI0025FFAB1B|nr:DUF6198 family protein [uncultured Holdemanella sp.]
MDKKRLQILVYVVGMFILAIGLTLNTKANLGVSPIISVPYSISQITGLNFGDLTFVVYAIFVVVQIIIHIRLKNHKRIVSDILQLPLSLIFTRLLNIFSTYIPTAQNLGIRFIVLTLAIICTGVGAAMSLSMQLVPNPGDGIVQSLAEGFNKSVGLTKNLFDCFNLCITLCISIFIAHQIVGVGIGTLIAVLGVGRVIALFHHIFEYKIEELICK